MKRKTLLLLLLLAGMCNALVAQKLTTRKTYYDYWELHIQHMWTELPDGTPHGKWYHYREDGTLYSIQEYDHYETTNYTRYYQDGKTIKYKISGKTIEIPWVTWNHELKQYEDGIISVCNYIGYDIEGNVTLQSTITQTKGDSCHYGTPYRDVRLNTNKHLNFKRGTDTYTSDGKTATLKINGLSCTYNFKTELLTVSNYTPEESNINFVVKNGIAEYNATEDVEVEIDGYVYLIKKGSHDKFTLGKIHLSKEEFAKQFYFSDIAYDMGTEIYTNYICVHDEPFINISLPYEYIKNKFKDSIIGLKIKYEREDETRRLKLTSGTFENGVLEDKTLSVTTKDGQIVSLKGPNDDITVATSTSQDGYLYIHAVEGTKKNGDNHWSKTGKFNNEGQLIEGTLIKDYNNGYFVYTGTFENEKLVSSGRIDYKDADGYSETYEGTFNDGDLLEGSITVKKANGYIKILEGTFEDEKLKQGIKTQTLRDGTRIVAEGTFEDEELKQGTETHTLTDGTRIVAEGTFTICDDPYYDILINNGTLIISYSNGTKASFDGTFELDKKTINNKITNEDVDIYHTRFCSGKFVDLKGNTYEGTFKDFYITKNGLIDLKPQFDIYHLIKGSVNVTTELGKYIGNYSNGCANGQGKLILPNGSEWVGAFVDNKLCIANVSTVTYVGKNGDIYKGEMHNGIITGQGTYTLANGDYYTGEFIKGKFSGTGTVRYTHKNGVFEGKVENFVCQYDTPQDKKALKKVGAPKMPKIAFPETIGRIVN